MAHPAISPRISNARGGPINDAALEQLIAAGERWQQHDELSDEDAALVLLTLPQLASELLHRRKAMTLISDVSDIDNVTLLHGK